LASSLIFGFLSQSYAALTFDWNGSGTSWTSSSSWNETGGSGSYPGAAGRTTDIVRFGVTGSSYTKQPTLTSSLTIASIEFGGGIETAGTKLTVTGVTLTVGTITQDINTTSSSNTIFDYLQGTGTISCTTITVGSGTNTTGTFNFLLSDIATLNVSGNVVIISNVNKQNGCGFRLEDGDMYLAGQVTFTSLSGITASNASYFTINTVAQAGGNTTPHLYLSNPNPLGAIPTPHASVNFYGDRGGTGTVTYTAASPTIYTTSTAGFGSGGGTIDTTKSAYDNLTIQGSGTATIGGSSVGALKVTGDFTTASPATFSSSAATNTSIGGNWINSSTVTTTSGTTAVSGNITNSSAGNITLGSGNVYVGASVTNSGTFNTGSGNVSIDGSVTNSSALTLSSGNVTIGSNYSNTGTFTAGTGTVYFSSASAQSLADNSATGTTLNNVDFKGGGTKTMSGTGSFAVSSSGILTMEAGNILQTGGILTLKSSSTGSATVGAIPSNSSITGTVNVERYFTGGSGYRGYRLVSSPVYAATVSSNNVYSINYLQSSTYLTGSAGGGFDKTGNPTMYLYREDQTPNNSSYIDGNFWGISAINNSPTYNYSVTGGATVTSTVTSYLPVGNGVMYFFRGNRASAPLLTETQPSYTTPVTVTTTTAGTLNQQQVIVHIWYTPTSPYLTISGSGTGTNSVVRGFNLVGNPYASSIDWEQYNTTTTTSGIYANNVSTTIYEFDPLTHNYDTYQVGGAFTNHGTRTIASGQGFFVQATNSTNPQLIFNESAKSNTQNTGLNLLMSTGASLAAANANGNANQYLRLQLSVDSVNADDIYIGFNPAAKPQYDITMDAAYRVGGGAVSLCSLSGDNVPLAINKLPLPKLNQTVIPLKVAANNYGTYKLNMTEVKRIRRLYEIWLMDRWKKDSLDMRNNTTYAFDMTTDTNSYGSHRFSLVIRQNHALGVHLLNFTAAKAKDGAQVVWKTENEENYTNFTLERSNDGGATFSVLAGVPSSALGTYSFTDKNPPPAADIYRLKIEDLNGTVTYSNVVTLMYSNTSNALVKTGISLFPNPAKGTLNLLILDGFNASATSQPPVSSVNQAPGSSNSVYNIEIVNALGSVIKNATTSQPNWQTDVSNLLPGTYIIQVVNKSTNSVLGKGTFVKL